MKNLIFPLFLLVATLAVSSGCSSPPPMAGMRLELTAVERTSDGRTVATVLISNPNLVAYNLVRVSHRIQFGSGATGTLDITQPTGVPAQNSAVQTGTLELDRGAALSAGTDTYRMDSRVVLRLYGERTDNTKISSSGQVVVK